MYTPGLNDEKFKALMESCLHDIPRQDISLPHRQLDRFVFRWNTDESILNQSGVPIYHSISRVSRFTPIYLMDHSKVKLSPIVLAKYARVALGDEIGKLLNATTTLMLIGERPGLASADSLSVYFTYQPEPGRNDAHRNCISNIHKSGLSPQYAAQMAHFLFQSAFQKKLSGVDLKIEYPALVHR